MRNAIDQLIDLAILFTTEVSLTKDVDGQYLVSIRRVSAKNKPMDGVICGICGRGDSVESACSNFLSEAKGKLLIGDDPSFYGENRPEYICV